MRQTFTLMCMVCLTTLAFAQPTIPIDFESGSIDYTFNDFAGGEAMVIDNPDASGINTSAKVGQLVKFDGEVYGGSTLPLAGAIDFGSNNAIKMKVWANRAGAPVLFKLEGVMPVEVSMSTTVANAWEELTFSFAGLTGFEYTAITIIYDLGVVGDGSADFTLYFDDIEFTSVVGGVAIPVDFESTELTYVFNDFAGGVATVIDNPDASGINTSAKVAQMIKFDGEVYGGSTLPLGVPVDFGTNNAISMKVWTNRANAPVLFKLEGSSPVEVNVSTTVANQWEELVYNFTGLTGGVYTGITIIYDLGVVGDGGADFTMFFDDISYTNFGGEVVQLPVDFQSKTLTYTFSNFAGGVASIIDNPDASGINTSTKVAQMIKFAGEVYGGSTLALGAPVDFGDNTMIRMKVWTNRTNAPVLFKLEGSAPVELNMNPTVANQWEELTYDFTGFTGGVYTGITIIYDLGVVGDGGADFTMFFDDIEIVETSSTASLEDLGVTYYPNPVQDMLSVNAPSAMTGIQVYDLMGRLVLQTQPTSDRAELGLAALRAGVYVLLVSTADQVGAAKFVKQ